MLLLPFRPVGNTGVCMEMMPAHKIDLDLIESLLGQLRIVVLEFLKQVIADRIELIRTEIFKVCIRHYFFEEGFWTLRNFSGHNHVTDTPDFCRRKEMLCKFFRT